MIQHPAVSLAAASLLVVSSRAPYQRGGLAFGFAAGRAIAAIVKPLAEFTDIDLAQLVADPHVVVVPLPAGHDADVAGKTVAEIAASVDRHADTLRREIDVVDREQFAAGYLASLDTRARLLDDREERIAEREAAVRRAMPEFLAADGFTRSNAAPIYTGTTFHEGVMGTTTLGDVRARAAAEIRNVDEAVDADARPNDPDHHAAVALAAGSSDALGEAFTGERVIPPLDGLLASKLVESDAGVAAREARAADLEAEASADGTAKHAALAKPARHAAPKKTTQK